jgi:hypothetical protein
MARATIFVILVLALHAPSFATDPVRSSQEDDIREAVFRYLFDHNGSGQQHNAHAYCLAIVITGEEIDPSAQLIKRFAHHKPPIRKASACHSTEIQVVENRWEKPALIFSVSEIEWISDTEVAITGGYEEANNSSSFCGYTVSKQKGQWTVAASGGACVVSKMTQNSPHKVS